MTCSIVTFMSCPPLLCFCLSPGCSLSDLFLQFSNVHIPRSAEESLNCKNGFYCSPQVGQAGQLGLDTNFATAVLDFATAKLMAVQEGKLLLSRAE